MRIDVFCRVVDNYGDIGVCWRLARRLAHGHGAALRLWVDDLRSFARLEPAVDTARPIQTVQGIEVRHWTGDAPVPEPGDMVIEAFACDPPPAFVAAMRVRRPAPLWVNLEYLSAEPWIEDCHALPSLRPDGLTKYFFFPGFTARTGGLLREPGLIAARDAWQRDPAARAALLARLGLPPCPDGARLVTLFCYPDAPVDALLDGLQAADGATLLAVPDGAAPTLPAGRHGRVTVARYPLVPQEDFDRLLWSADLNLVRGEDSFVRAHWAGRPMLWQIYPQDEDAHWDKLDAWLALVAPPPFVAALNRGWNGAPGEAPLAAQIAAALSPSAFRDWAAAAARFSAALAQQEELADSLMAWASHRFEASARI